MEKGNSIFIGSPFIEDKDFYTRMIAKIRLPDGSIRPFYFEVDRTYGQYLCPEVSDAFLIGIIDYAFQNGYDIECEAPVSNRLLYQIQTYLIPTLADSGNKHYKKISVKAAPFDGAIENAGGVGASASGGVDSYFSIVKHTNKQEVDKKYQLTHLLIADQFNIYGSEEKTRIRFEELKVSSKKIADNYGLDFVGIYTNHQDFLYDGFVQQYTFRICSYVFALQKLFSVYYVSSGTSFKDFNFKGHDSDDYDIFNLSMVSTDSLSFYSSGGETGRTQKIAYFADDSYIESCLKVCNGSDACNCSRCEKCMRTMLSLDIIGKLDKFYKVFDLNEFRKNRDAYLATVISGKLVASPDLLDNAQKYGYHIPAMSYIKGCLVDRTFWKLKEFLKKIKFLRKLYFRLNLDFIVYGKEKAALYRYGTEYEIK